MSLEESPSESLRHQLAGELERLAPPELYGRAATYLADPAWRVRRAAWEALLRSGAPKPEVYRFLIDTLCSSDDANVRGSMLEALISQGEACVPAIKESLVAQSGKGKRYLLDVLIQLGSPSAVAVARELVRDEDENVGFAAAEVVGTAGTVTDAEGLLEDFESYEGTRRFAVLVALVQIAKRTPFSVAPRRMLPYLQDPLLRAPAFELLGLCGGEGTGVLLWEHVTSGLQIDSALLALAAFLSRGGARGIEPDAQKLALIVERCRDSGTGVAVRKAAFDVTAHISPPNLAPLLPVITEVEPSWLSERLLQLPADTLRSVLTSAMLTPEGRSVAARIYGSRPDLDGESSLLALLNREGDHLPDVVNALAEVGTGRSAPHLIALCERHDGPLGTMAADAVVRLIERGAPEAADALLRGSDERSNAAIVRLMPALGLLVQSEAGYETLNMMFRHPSARVRRAALYACESAGHLEEVRGLIVARLADEDEEVRSAAAEMAGRIKVPQAIEPLRVLLSDDSPWVQASAITAMTALGAPLPLEQTVEILRRGGVTAVTAAHAVGSSSERSGFPALSETLLDLDDDTLTELLKALANYEQDLAPETVEKIRRHASWQVRAAGARYLTDKAKPWMRELACSWLETETDELVRSRLGEAVEK